MLTGRDYARAFGEGFEPEETPETVAYGASLDFSAQVVAEAGRQGIALKDLAARIGTSQPNLSRKLGGRSNLTLKSMAEIALALGCDMAPPQLAPRPRLSAEATLGGLGEAEWIGDDPDAGRVLGSAGAAISGTVPEL